MSTAKLSIAVILMGMLVWDKLENSAGVCNPKDIVFGGAVSSLIVLVTGPVKFSFPTVALVTVTSADETVAEKSAWPLIVFFKFYPEGPKFTLVIYSSFSMIALYIL